MGWLQGALFRYFTERISSYISDSMSLTRKRSSPLFAAQTRPLSYSIYLNPRVQHYGPQSRPDFRYAHSERQYSTSIPPSEKTEVTPEAVPLVGPRSKKQKVELRPAPLRPKSAAPTLPTPKPSTNAAVSRAPTAAGPSSSSASAQSEGVIEVAKHDVEDAAQHGILKPPPENANKIMKLFHQAKELFVRPTYQPHIPLMNLRLEILRKRPEADQYQP